METEKNIELLSSNRGFSVDGEAMSLVGLCLILYRRRRVIGVVISIFLIAGACIAFFSNTKYVFTSTLEIASDWQEPIESVETVHAKLSEGYIPHIFEEREKEEGYMAAVEAQVLNGSRLILLSSEGVPADAGKIEGLHKLIVGEVISDHDPVIDMKRNLLEKDRLLVDGHLLAVSNRVRDLKRKRTNLLARTEKLESELVTKKLQLARIEDNNKKVLGISEREDLAINLLMTGREYSMAEKGLRSIETRLYVEIPKEIDFIDARIMEEEKVARGYQTSIFLINTEINGLNSSRIISFVMNSAKPVGVGKVVVVMLFFMLGIIAGIIVALFQEFVANASEEIRRE